MGRTIAAPRDSMLRADAHAEIQARIAALAHDAAPAWGRMTANEMVCHLADAFRMALGERPGRSRATMLSRTVVRWAALHTPMPFPRNMRTLSELRQGSGGTPPDAFEGDVAALHALLDRFMTALPALDGRAHPLFGPLTPWEWARWAYRHTDHHLRQFGV